MTGQDLRKERRDRDHRCNRNYPIPGNADRKTLPMILTHSLRDIRKAVEGKDESYHLLQNIPEGR